MSVHVSHNFIPRRLPIEIVIVVSPLAILAACQCLPTIKAIVALAKVMVKCPSAYKGGVGTVGTRLFAAVANRRRETKQAIPISSAMPSGTLAISFSIEAWRRKNTRAGRSTLTEPRLSPDTPYGLTVIALPLPTGIEAEGENASLTPSTSSKFSLQSRARALACDRQAICAFSEFFLANTASDYAVGTYSMADNTFWAVSAANGSY